MSAATISFRIVIDNEDRAGAPEKPFTATLYGAPFGVVGGEEENLGCGIGETPGKALRDLCDGSIDLDVLSLQVPQ